MAHGILALLLTLGTDVGNSSPDEFVARGPGFATTVRFYEHSLIGPTIQMGRYGRTLRGSAYGAATEMSWDDTRVTGLSGGAPVNLAYRVEADGSLRMDGMFAGNLTHLEVGPLGIRGHIGPRDFVMDGRSGVFLSLFPAPVEIEIPSALRAREPGEQAAVLPILLAGFAGPSTTPVVPQPRVLPEILARRKNVQGNDYADAFRVAPPPGWPHMTATSPRGRIPSGGISGSIGSGASSSTSTAASHAMGHRGSSK